MVPAIGKLRCKLRTLPHRQLNSVYFGPQTAKNRTRVLSSDPPTGGHQAGHCRASIVSRIMQCRLDNVTVVRKPSTWKLKDLCYVQQTIDVVYLLQDAIYSRAIFRHSIKYENYNTKENCHYHHNNGNARFAVIEAYIIGAK